MNKGINLPPSWPHLTQKLNVQKNRPSIITSCGLNMVLRALSCHEDKFHSALHGYETLAANCSWKHTSTQTSATEGTTSSASYLSFLSSESTGCWVLAPWLFFLLVCLLWLLWCCGGSTVGYLAGRMSSVSSSSFSSSSSVPPSSLSWAFVECVVCSCVVGWVVVVVVMGSWVVTAPLEKPGMITCSNPRLERPFKSRGHEFCAQLLFYTVG